MATEYTPSPVIRRDLVTMGMVLLISTFAALGVDADNAITLTFETEGSIALIGGDSIKLGQNLSRFYAIRKAAEEAAEQFIQQGLIQFVDKDKNELVNLVADSLSTEIVKDRCNKKGDAVGCLVRARTVVRLSDFIEAQLISLRLEAQERREDYRHEMEPQVQDPLRPGWVLAKAYRLIRQKELRMAIIYLDRLADVYPSWWEIYHLKAIAFRQSNQPDRMTKALRKACKLGSPTACAESI